MLPESLLPAYRAAFRYAVIPWLAVLGVVVLRARTDNANTVLMVPGTPAAPAIAITPGKRAYSVRIDDVNGIAGMVSPNSRVDVLITAPWSGERRIARIFMSNMRVVAIGWTDQGATDGSSIRTQVATLELTPEEVERLAIAANLGSISLALRGHGDWDQISTEGAMTSEVVKKLPQRPTPPR